jgi:hypothetical protein
VSNRAKKQPGRRQITASRQGHGSLESEP